MVGEIQNYVIDDTNRVVDVIFTVSEDTGALVETTQVVVPIDTFSASMVLQRINEVLARHVLGKQAVPSKATLEGILPLESRTQVPG